MPGCRTDSLPSLLFALTLILNFLRFTSASVQPTQPQNLSITNINHCTDNYNWLGPGTFPQHCIRAVQRLYEVEIMSRPDNQTDFEFLTPRAVPGSPEGLLAVRTPRKYTYGTCTLAIVMLNAFNNRELPGGVKEFFPSRDVTSFFELWQAAMQLETVCLLHSGQVGWAAEGTRDSIGIFLWSTNSNENRNIPPGVPIPSSPSSPSSPFTLPSNSTTQSDKAIGNVSSIA